MTKAKANSTKPTPKPVQAPDPVALLARACERLDSIEIVLLRISDQLARGVDRPGIDLSRHI